MPKHTDADTPVLWRTRDKRGTFAATFFLACLAAMELEGVVLDEI
jgi:hypothetical protein